MFDEEDVKKAVNQERRGDKRGKYKPLHRNPRTEKDLTNIFNYGTEIELVRYLEAHELPDGSADSERIVKLFREHAAKRR
jgi:hypothetical protein